MSTYAGIDLFASGPHHFAPGPWERCLQRRGFAGLDGELVLDLGLRGRNIVQAGRLQAPTAEELQAQLSAIEAICDGREHELIDALHRRYARAILEEFKPQPIRHGRGLYGDYQILYRQLP